MDQLNTDLGNAAATSFASDPVFVLMSNKWNKFVFNNLAVLRQEGTLCDVTLQGNDDKSLLAHSSVLAAASSVLKSCLVQAPRGHYVVKIPSISSTIWEMLLSYMYTGKVKAMAKNKQELITATQTLGLNELNGLCSAIHDVEPPKPAEPVLPGGDNMETTEITIMNEDSDPPNAKDGGLAEELMKIPDPDEGKNKYQCKLCGKSFPFGRSLIVHEMMHKEKKVVKHQCSKCSKTFQSYHSLRAHERTHRYLPFRCDLCNTGFHFRVNYDLHRKKVHDIGGDLFQCSECGKEFLAIGLLHRHLVTVHKMKKEEIEEIEAANAAAEASANDLGGESSQGQETEAEIGGQCLECNLQFDNREQLSQHFKTVHRVKKDIKCSECGEMFKNVLSLKEHFATHTGETYEKPFKCQYCDKRYLYNYAVVQHEKDAHLMQPQQCNVCHIVLKSERALQKHMKLHEGQIAEDLWKCSVCDKKYTDRPSYALHMAEHRGEKTYYCKYCQKGFPHKGNYSTHMQRHLGIKPFKCQFCSKSFVRKDDMKSHMRVHTGEKPFSCQVCGMKFAGVSNLREHERAKHNVSFSKRNPVTTPRQHRTKQHRGSKTVEPIDITQEGALADLADVVTGVLNTSKDNQAELVIEQQMPRGMATSAAATEVMDSKQHTMTVLQQPDGTFTQVHVSDQQEQGYEQLYTMGDQVYQVVMDTSSGTMKQIIPDAKEYPEGGNVLSTVDQVQEGQIVMDQS